jgi:hypothetical protein
MEPTGTSFAMAAWPQHPGCGAAASRPGARMTVIEETRSTDEATSEQNCSPCRARYLAAAPHMPVIVDFSDLSFQVTQ